MNKSLAAMLAAIFTLCGAGQSMAQVTAVNLGTSNPPATLGSYTMSVVDPGSVLGASYYSHETDGNGDGGGTGIWQTWGQNYTGNVYVSENNENMTLNFSGGTEAFYFYMEPDEFEDFNMTATDTSGATVTTTINGYYGSAGVGFYEDVPNGDYLSEVTVTCTDPMGFAVGEFGIDGGSMVAAVPESSTMGMAALGLLFMLAFRRFKIRTA